MKKKVLLIDVEVSSKGQCAAALSDLGWDVSTANTGSGALTLLGVCTYNGVTMPPGATALTRTPRPEYSDASDRVSRMTPPFEAA